MRDTLLTAHVLAGTAGLLFGPAWLWARRLRRAHSLAWAYQAAIAAVSVTGAWLAMAAPELAWLLALAVLTEALAAAGAVARRRGWANWRTLQPHLLGGSYIGLVTALLVAETGNPVFWVLPSLVGQLPIAVAKHRLHGAARELQAVS